MQFCLAVLTLLISSFSYAASGSICTEAADQVLTAEGYGKLSQLTAGVKKTAVAGGYSYKTATGPIVEVLNGRIKKIVTFNDIKMLREVSFHQDCRVESISWGRFENGGREVTLATEQTCSDMRKNLEASPNPLRSDFDLVGMCQMYFPSEKSGTQHDSQERKAIVK